LKLPRDIEGIKLAAILHGLGYEITRQTGSHIRLTCSKESRQHHITVPAHRELRIGTLHPILREVATFLHIEQAQLLEQLFGS
jgi:predicted RNA binding protein YcfA (HicA-like mRNA interferase family)